jgi:hypothetical protein
MGAGLNPRISSDQLLLCNPLTASPVSTDCVWLTVPQQTAKGLSETSRDGEETSTLRHEEVQGFERLKPFLPMTIGCMGARHAERSARSSPVKVQGWPAVSYSSLWSQ